MKFKASIFALLFATAQHGQAQTTYTWDGGGYLTDGNWGTAANWSADTKPVGSSNTVLTFSGDRNSTANNNLGDWALDIGQLNFSSTVMQTLLTGNNFGFLPLNGSQQINQNSAFMPFISNTAFAFRSGSDSQINLNAGGLLINSNVYLDASGSTARQFVIGGTTNDLNTLVLNGTVAKSGSGYDPDMVIQNNKRVAVYGALTFGSGTDGSVFIKSGRLEFNGTGSMTGAPVIGSSSGSDSAMLLLNGAGQTMANQLEIVGGSTGRRVIGGQNTSGNVTFSGTIIGNNSPASYDVVAATGGSVTLSGTRNFDSALNINRPDGSTTYGGTVILSGTSSSTSGVNVYGGTLSVGADNQMGSSGAITINGGTLKQSAGFDTSRNIVIGSNGGKIDLNSVSSDTRAIFSGPISGTGNLVLAGVGDATNFNGMEGPGLVLSGNSTYVGSTTIVSGWVIGFGATAFGNTDNTVVLNGGGLNYQYTVANSYKISLAGAGGAIKTWETVTATGAISGTGQLTKAGYGTLILATANTYSGATRAVEGALNLQNVNALSMSTLDLATADNGTVGFTVSGASTYNLGGLKGTRGLALGANSLAIGANNESTIYTGVLSGQGGLSKAGSGVLTLTGANTYSGGTTISTGTLQVGQGGSTGSLAGNVTNNATLAFNRSNAVSYTGVVSGVGALTKAGSGALTLTGANTYSGATTVSAGSLVVNGNISTSSLTTVQGGALLGGSGSTGSVMVESGGTLAPGNSPGTLIVNGTLSLAAGSTFAYQYTGGGTAADLMQVNGALSLGTGALLSLQNLGAFTQGDKFTLFAYESLTGTFSGYADDTTYTLNGGDWRFNYNDTSAGVNGGTGSGFITMTAVPEPGAALLGALGGLLALRRRRNA